MTRYTPGALNQMFVQANADLQAAAMNWPAAAQSPVRLRARAEKIRSYAVVHGRIAEIWRLVLGNQSGRDPLVALALNAKIKYHVDMQDKWTHVAAELAVQADGGIGDVPIQAR